MNIASSVNLLSTKINFEKKRNNFTLSAVFKEAMNEKN